MTKPPLSMDDLKYTVLVPQEAFGDNLTLSVDGVYSDRRNLTRNSRGTIQATIFGPVPVKAARPSRNWRRSASTVNVGMSMPLTRAAAPRTNRRRR